MIWPAAALAIAAAGPVELRGGGVVGAPVVSVSAGGVEVGGDEGRVIGWDNVKRVVGEGSEAAWAYMEMAERAWRARIRLARGDYGMSSPLLERLAVELEGEEGPTPLMVWEGVLACRLWFGDRGGALEAWLEAVRLRSLGWEVAGDPPLDPIVDPETLLTPSLPPVLLEWDESMLTAAAGVSIESGGETESVASRLRYLYWAGARRAMGLGPEVDDALVQRAAGEGAWHDGVALVGQMVDAMSDDAARRASARDLLESGLEADGGTWREAWRRAALGRSLLMEGDEGLRLDGLFHLVHLPARFSRSQPFLAAASLALMSEELSARGEATAAGRLRGELARRYPGDAALRRLDERAREGAGRDRGELTRESEASDE